MDVEYVRMTIIMCDLVISLKLVSGYSCSNYVVYFSKQTHGQQ